MIRPELKVGQKLAIPGATSAAAPATDMTASSSSGGGEEIYIVKSGDTLSKIAKRHGTTIKAIESENGLSTTHIKVGQKLKIPAKAEAAPAPRRLAARAAPPAAARAGIGQQYVRRAIAGTNGVRRWFEKLK